MTNRALCLAVAIACGTAACGGGNDTLESQVGDEQTVLSSGEGQGEGSGTGSTPVQPATPTADTDTVSGGSKQFTFQPVGGGAGSGSVTVTPFAKETQIAMLVRGAAGSGAMQANVVRGRCADAAAAAVAPLPALQLQGGTASGVAKLPLDPQTVLNGQHSVRVHQAGGNPGAPVLCAEIQAVAAGSSEPVRVVP